MGTMNVTPATVTDYRRIAERRLPRFLFDYVDGGANDELTLQANESELQALRLRQRVMRDVSRVDTSVSLLGERAAMPLALAPVGMAGLMARRAEVQAVRAANAAGVPYTLSTVGICSLEEVSNASSAPFWFQLYMLRDRGAVSTILQRAHEQGCKVLQFTVDLAVAGMRHRDIRNGMFGGKPLPSALARGWQILTHPRWAVEVGLRGKPHTFGNIVDMVDDPRDLNSFRVWVERQFDPSVGWKDIEWLRGQWRGKLVIKGVLDAEDARAAVDCGADAVVVSNHGGRQLDGVSSSIRKLPDVAAAVADRCEVLMDGGVRNGVDVVRAIALGARAVQIGRPWVWAVAAHGESGVSNLLAMLQKEMRVAMALCGVNNVQEITAELLDR